MKIKGRIFANTIAFAFLVSLFAAALYASALTKAWDFNNSEDYKLSTAGTVLFKDGSAQLTNTVINDNTSAVQMNFDTHYDAVIKWRLLDAGKLSGNFLSKGFEAPVPVKWRTFSWTPYAPYGKALPDNASKETGYAAGNVDMAGNVLLLHMNGDINDTSGSNITCAQTNPSSFANEGAFGKSLINSASNIINCGTDPRLDLADGFTIEAWVKTNNAVGYQTIASRGHGGNGDYWMGFYENTTILQLWADGCKYVDLNSASLEKNKWHHIAYTFQKGTNGLKIYVNGSLYREWTTPPSNFTCSDMQGTSIHSFKIGTAAYFASVPNGQNSYYFNGNIDEVAVYRKALAPNEISDRYKRGALRLKLRAKACNNETCGSPLGETDYLTDVSTNGKPLFDISSLPESKFVQYEAIFESDILNDSPKLIGAEIVSFLPTSDPYVESKDGVEFSTLSGFTEVLGAEKDGTVKYQISPDDGLTWYYNDAVSWQTTTKGFENSNTATEIASAISSLPTGDNKKFKFRAFFHSDNGVKNVQLDEVKIAGSLADPIPPPPVLPTVTVVAEEPHAFEGGELVGKFKFTRDPVGQNDLTVNYFTATTNAVDNDISPIGTSVVIPAGQSSAVIEIKPIDDAVAEQTESVVIFLNEDNSYSVGSPKSAEVKIYDNDAYVAGAAEEPSTPGVPKITIAAINAIAERGSLNATLEIIADPAPENDLVVKLVLGGTALPNVDFKDIGQTVVIPKGQDATILNVIPLLLADGGTDENRTLSVTVDPNSSGQYKRGKPDTVTVVISGKNSVVGGTIGPAEPAGKTEPASTDTQGKGGGCSIVDTNKDSSAAFTFALLILILLYTRYARAGRKACPSKNRWRA